MVLWFNQENTSSAVTIYKNNITINKKALLLLQDAYRVQVGFDPTTKQILIKKITKEEAEKINGLLELTIKPSFGRINNRSLILHLSNFIDFDFEKQSSYKYQATWNNGTKTLYVDTKEGIINV